MKFSTSKQKLQTALQKVSRATPTRSTLPILNCVLIETSQSKTILRSTDLELTIQVELSVSVEEEGKVCLPVKTLLDITNELPETRITLTEKKLNVTIETKFGKYNIMGKSYEEFPAIPIMKEEKSIMLSGKSLKDVIKKTYFAISTDELKPALTGVLFRLKNKSITAVSTDGHRLVRYIKRDSISNDIDGDFIAPRKFLNFLQTQNLNDEVNIILGDAYIAAKLNNDLIISRLIDERFPDYESVIPKDNNNILTVTKSNFLSAVKRVSIFSNRSTHQVAINLKEKHSCEVLTEDPEKASKAKEVLSVDYKGEDLLIGYNAEYLKDVISHISGDDVKIEFNTSISAALFSSNKEDSNSNILMLLMPIRLND